MAKRTFFYLFIAGIIAVAFVLGLTAGGVFSKKSAKPMAKAPPVVEKKAPLPVPVVEEKAAPPVLSSLTPATPIEKGNAFFQKGVCYVAWTENGYSNANSVKSMEELASLGVDSASLITTWYQQRYNSTEIAPQADKTPSDQSLIFAIRKLRDLKIKVMLKPHLDLIESEGKWRGDIEMNNTADWEAWFKSYSEFVLYYAKLAAQENVELLCIGTELAQSTLGQPQMWRDLIKKVREVYKGQLTYAANWDKEFKEISFWDALDYAGIDPYFPLVCSLRPKVSELVCVWGDWIKTIEEWQKKIDRPVIFTEIGYKSSLDAADEPWQHMAMGELSLELQVNLYTSLLQSFWDKPWFYGVYWWYWGANPKMGGTLNRGFTPQNKPAQDAIKEWYAKPASVKVY